MTHIGRVLKIRDKQPVGPFGLRIPFPELPKKLPKRNSPEYVALAREVAVKMGRAATAPRTFFQAIRTRAEQKYRRLLARIFKYIETKIKKCGTVEEVTSTLRGIVSSPEFSAMCHEAPRQMATMLAAGQKASWREAAAEAGHAKEIYRALMNELQSTAVGPAVSNIVEQNAALIKTVPQNMARQFSELSMKRRYEGVRTEDIMQEILEKAPHLREYEARRIARTESAKASTALIQARCEAFGLDFYEWHSVRDERTRDAHYKMSGVICRWSDPPNPEALFPGGDSRNSGGNYHPGCIYNCRCIPFPVTRIENIKFPARVHVAGHIETINNLQAFRERFNLPEKKGDKQ